MHQNKPFSSKAAILPGVPTAIWVTPLLNDFIWSSTLMCFANSFSTLAWPLNAISCLKCKERKKSNTWEDKLCIIQKRTTETHLMRSIVLRADPQTMSNTTDWVWVCCFWILAHFGQTEIKCVNMNCVNKNYLHVSN